jgi:hypothetical protein
MLIMILLMGHLAQMAVWAITFVAAGEFETFADAFYHSAVNYTTLGLRRHRHVSALAPARAAGSRERHSRVRLVDRCYRDRRDPAGPLPTPRPGQTGKSPLSDGTRGSVNPDFSVGYALQDLRSIQSLVGTV